MTLRCRASRRSYLRPRGSLGGAGVPADVSPRVRAEDPFAAATVLFGLEFECPLGPEVRVMFSM